MGTATHRRQRYCLTNKNTAVSIDASIMETAAFFFARPYGWVAVGREITPRIVGDDVLDVQKTNDHRQPHGVCDMNGYGIVGTGVPRLSV